MRTLYLQQNCIQTIENLSHMKELANLNLSENFIDKIQNLSALTSLQTLHLSKNNLCSVEDLAHLSECSSIEILDLSNNRINDESILEEVIFKMKQLKYLKLDGNAFVRSVKFYRKKIILNLPNLNYLDNMPVFEDERRAAQAWERGGLPEEKKEREIMRTEEKEKHINSMKALDKMLEDHKEELKQKRIAHELEEEMRSKEEIEQKDEQEELNQVDEHQETNQVDDHEALNQEEQVESAIESTTQEEEAHDTHNEEIHNDDHDHPEVEGLENQGSTLNMDAATSLHENNVSNPMDSSDTTTDLIVNNKASIEE